MRIPRHKQRQAKRFIAAFIYAKALGSSAFEDENGDDDELLKAAVERESANG
jgi:hypothetical protein